MKNQERQGTDPAHPADFASAALDDLLLETHLWRNPHAVR